MVTSFRTSEQGLYRLTCKSRPKVLSLRAVPIDNAHMDIIRFALTERHDAWKKREVPCIDISINGEPLEVLIGQIERPFAEAEGNPQIAGQYLGLELGEDVRSARHFLGDKGSNLLCEPQGHTAVMRDSDGGLWEWPLMVHISLLERFVIWSEFVQPHRAGKWRYDDVKFTFDREQYEDELRRLDDQIAAAKAARPTPTLFEIKKLFRRDPPNP
jgi:hypothetical protein